MKKRTNMYFDEDDKACMSLIKEHYNLTSDAAAVRLAIKRVAEEIRGNAPLVLEWPWETPRTVVIRWTGTQYEAVATYKVDAITVPQGHKIAGIDLGEIHLAVAHDGEQTIILNGRVLRSKRQYQNKLKAKLSNMIDT